MLKLALSIHNSPRVYALLIGSGVSRAAGIPTGYEIVLDLARQLAIAEDGKPPPDPRAWYVETFGQEPDYSYLIQALAKTQPERMKLLQGYFEPTEEERLEGKKVPTTAHKRIAGLVGSGCVKIILTTNFDRLIEDALRSEGIPYDVISSEDDLRGALPTVHSDCVVVKLHGDYRDTRIRNTPEELGTYPESLNQFLDRILDEYGLVVCGWSASWDTALVGAILRCPNRRFTTYWAQKGSLTEEAHSVIEKRKAEVIPIENADNFFDDLLDKIEAIRDLRTPDPVSVSAAVATVKRYISDPGQWIRLDDIFREETERTLQDLDSDDLFPKAPPSSDEEFRERVTRCECVTQQLQAMSAALAHYDKGENSHLLVRSIQRLAQAPSARLRELKLYPAMLVEYAAGISATAAARFLNLGAILMKSLIAKEGTGERTPAIRWLNPRITLGLARRPLLRKDGSNASVGPSTYVLDVLRPALTDYLPSDRDYEEVSDVFEFLVGLTVLDITKKDWAPLGRFAWRWDLEGDRSPFKDLIRRYLGESEDSELLQAGFFGGSLELARELLERYEEIIPELKRKLEFGS